MSDLELSERDPVPWPDASSSADELAGLAHQLADAREREAHLNHALDEQADRLAGEEGLRLELEREREYSAELRSRVRDLRGELAMVKLGRSAGGGTRAGDAHRAELDELIADVHRDGAARPSRVEILDRETVPLALGDPPVPSLPLPAGPIARPELRVATVMDQFTRLAFRYEFDLIDLHPDEWERQLQEHRPHALIVESAWRGTDDRWAHRISNSRYDDIARLTTACRAAGIPTIFWNKEDPANFEWFVHNAPLFDHVFTTDEDCIDRYRKVTGHDRIHVLPFAAQPRIHNPIRIPGGRTRSVAFAGTYYARKHPDRRVQMDAVLAPAREFGLDIFSRVPDRPSFQFPDEYQPYIVGTLPYPDLLTAHKMYRAFINVNSVIGSRSMCARRIFELLASGASVVSGVSPAIEALLGPGIVRQSATPETTRAALTEVLADEAQREREAVRALRTILGAHSYGHRTDYLCATVGLPQHQADTSLTVVSVIRTADDARALRANLRRQVLRPTEVLAVVPGEDDAGRWGLEDLEASVHTISAPPGGAGVGLGLGTARATGAHVAFLEPRDFYGAHYLEDAVATFAYAEVDIVGKAVVHEWPGGAIARDAPVEREFDEVPALHPSTLVGRTPRLRDIDWRDVDHGAHQLFLRDCRNAGLRLFSTDRFNFVAGPLEGDVRRAALNLSELDAPLAHCTA